MVELHDLLTVPALLETVAAYGGYDAVLALHATCRRIRGCTAAILERVGEMAVAGRTFRSLRRRHLKIGFVEGLDIASDSVDQADLQSQFEDGFQQAFETTLDEGSIRGQLMAFALLLPNTHPRNSEVEVMNRLYNGEDVVDGRHRITMDGPCPHAESYDEAKQLMAELLHDSPEEFTVK
ncbi:HECT domain-containing protein [Plasmodiophora brassicae]|uniref:Uncharacterized protein n=1 Tax=Plasmodiophora brassicae TaxID=37360 RepID=A0A0G4IQE8_PLABS|nr:hypothetical protein PBRA_000721 [Plasmodiophora brassicae]SPQ97687.1 unnamed protein product [Plasmodiophora brassicae]